MAKQTWEFEVSTLLLNESGKWVVQCLEYDIAAQGDSPAEAREAWQRAFVGQAIVNLKHDKEPMADVPRAPKFYWDLFAKAKEWEFKDHLEIFGSLASDPLLPPPVIVRAKSRGDRLAGGSGLCVAPAN